jgi:hypothetical protein
MLAACAKPHPQDAPLPGEHGREARVIDGDALVLARGYVKDGRMEVTHRLNLQVLPPSPAPLSGLNAARLTLPPGRD